MSTPEPSLYPLLFEPVLKDYIWGGRNLERRLGRPLPEGKEIAESWEIAAHPNGDVRVANGIYAGKTLSELTREMGRTLIGSRGAWALARDKFPLLIKLLDANSDLSVQVHPDDEYAQLHEDGELGKTEMWVILHAEENSSVILGVKSSTTADAFRDAMVKGLLECWLHEIYVSTGDFVCVPSGSLHAIRGGLLIAEVQQNSDVTYRVYDWNRVGDDGKPRPLHIDRAMDVINFAQQEPALPEARLISAPGAPLNRWELCRNPYFVVERLELPAGATFSDSCDGSTLQIWGATQGRATLSAVDDKGIELAPVTFTLLPARLGSYHISAGDRPAHLLRTYLR